MENTQRKMEALTAPVEVSRDAVLEFLKLADPSADRRLSSVTLGVRNGRLVLYYCDRAVSITERMGPFGYADTFPVLVSFKGLLAAMRGSKEDFLSLSWDRTKLYINGKRLSTHLDASPDCELRDAPADILTHPFPSAPLLEGLPAALQIIEPENPRNYGTCLKFALTWDTCSLVATDGFRLSYSNHRDLPLTAESLNGICLPAVACRQLLIAAKTGAGLSLGTSEDKTTLAVFTSDDRKMYLRTSAVKYPNYLGVIPKVFTGPAFVRKDLLHIAKMALAGSHEKSRMVILGERDGNLTLSTRKHDDEPWKTYSLALPEPFHFPHRLALNGRFLAETLQVSKEKTGMLCGLSEDGEAPIQIILGSVNTVVVPIKENDNA